MSELKMPSVLSFERKLDISDALFYETNWDKFNYDHARPITLREKSVRGLIVNRLKKSKNPEEELKKANLQKIDTAALSQECDTLLIKFSLRVNGRVYQPVTCNNPSFKKRLEKVVTAYTDINHFIVLAERYAYNLACGRFTWRNRLGADEFKIIVTQRDSRKKIEQLEFNALDFNLTNFDKKNDQLIALSTAFNDALASDNFSLFEVCAYLKIGNGQEVYPSQELILDKQTKKSKTLYSINGTAALHSQKIGNALRTIDTWYQGYGIDHKFPIPIEPYGNCSQSGSVFRLPKKGDFYSLFDSWTIKNKALSTDEQHYLIAMLIRGGVFGESEKAKEEKEDKE